MKLATNDRIIEFFKVYGLWFIVGIIALFAIGMTVSFVAKAVNASKTTGVMEIGGSKVKIMYKGSEYRAVTYKYYRVIDELDVHYEKVK